MNLEQKVMTFSNIEVALADNFGNVLIFTNALQQKSSKFTR